MNTKTLVAVALALVLGGAAFPAFAQETVNVKTGTAVDGLGDAGNETNRPDVTETSDLTITRKGDICYVQFASGKMVAEKCPPHTM